MNATLFQRPGYAFGVQVVPIPGHEPKCALVLREGHVNDVTIHLTSPDDAIQLGELIAKNGRELRAAEANRVADPTYTPTLEEAVRNPEEFVDGFTEAILR